MKIGGFPLLRIGGIAIVIDYFWPVMLFLLSYFTKEFFAYAYPEYSALSHWMLGGVSAVFIFLSVLIHELAHSFVSIKLGVQITSIRLHLFGGMSHAGPEPRSGRQELIIAITGWAASMAIGFFSMMAYIFLLLAQLKTPLAGIAACLMIANGALAALHLIPGFPLDGGRMLRAILWDRWNDMARATKVVTKVGNALALFFIIFGILQFLVIQSVVPGLLFIVGLYMKLSSVSGYQSVIQRQALVGIPVQKVMTENVVTVDWLLPLEEFVENYIYKHQFRGFPVFNRDELVGMVAMDGVKSIARDLWIFKQVRDIMVPIENVVCVRPTDDASEVLKNMILDDTGSIPVIDGEKMVGIVSRTDITNLLKIKSDLGTA